MSVKILERWRDQARAAYRHEPWHWPWSWHQHLRPAEDRELAALSAAVDKRMGTGS